MKKLSRKILIDQFTPLEAVEKAILKAASQDIYLTDIFIKLDKWWELKGQIDTFDEWLPDSETERAMLQIVGPYGYVNIRWLDDDQYEKALKEKTL